MKTPAFWQQDNFLARILAPLGWVYYGISRLHRWLQSIASRPQALSAPIICIGNVTAGGSGKTPATRMIASLLKIHGQNPHCISRGYGGKAQAEPVHVHAQKHSAKEVGDEPLLLAQTCESWVCTHRQKAATHAAKADATVILSDDGLQNPTFHKDISLLVIDSHYGIGNGLLIPAGPLREPLACALQKSDAVILIGEGNYTPPTSLPVWRAHLKVITDLQPYKQYRFVAFAGIAHPQKFFDRLRAEGLKVEEEVIYGDHHFYTATDVSLLQDKAEEYDAKLITTAKDFTKLPAAMREDCMVLDVKLQLEKPQEFLTWLEGKIAHG